MTGSDPPKDVHASRLKSLGTLVAAIAALVTATGAYFKPQDHSVNKATYEELTKVIKELSAESDRNHDDIVALRGFIEGTNAKRTEPSSTDAGAASLRMTAEAGAPTPPFVWTSSPPVPLPPVATAAASVTPPQSFDALLQKAKR